MIFIWIVLITIISYEGSLQFYQNMMPHPAPVIPAPPMMPPMGPMIPMGADMMSQVLPAISRMFNPAPDSNARSRRGRKRYKSSSESDESDKDCACECMSCNGTPECCKRLCSNCDDQDSVVFVPFPFPVPMPPPPPPMGLIPKESEHGKTPHDSENSTPKHQNGEKPPKPGESEKPPNAMEKTTPDTQGPTSSTLSTPGANAPGPSDPDPTTPPPAEPGRERLTDNCVKEPICRTSARSNKDIQRQELLPVRKLDRSIFDFNNQDDEYKMPPKKFIDQLVNAEMDMLEEERKLRNLLSNLDQKIQH